MKFPVLYFMKKSFVKYRILQIFQIKGFIKILYKLEIRTHIFCIDNEKTRILLELKLMPYICTSCVFVETFWEEFASSSRLMKSGKKNQFQS